MAEFVRLVYQDYLGIRIDVPSAVVRFEPKPPGIDSADVTASCRHDSAPGPLRAGEGDLTDDDRARRRPRGR
ncbi:MAG: hypothetical protein MZV64_29620 [Ignavibacteriales bacterium]|nr:hypothetical protein [Ignavibacteriales bacterium]